VEKLMSQLNRAFKCSLFVFLASFPLLTSADVPTKGKPRTARMVGGEFIQSSRSPIAYIETEEFSCSGTLVAPQQILTAAHCIGGSAEKYSVMVGGKWFGVSEIIQNSSYDQNGTTESSNSKFDVGMLILSTSVTHVPPIPIALNSPLAPGNRGYIFGFGTNQFSSNAQPKDFGKAGKVIITAVADGMFDTDAADTGVTVCSGDSGGPVISVVNSFPSVIGVVSTSGSGDESDGSCTEGDGTSQFVDIQSTESQEFLAGFPDARSTGGTFEFLAQQSATLEKEATKASKQRDLKKLKSLSKSISMKLGGLRPYVDSTRESLFNRAISALKRASASKRLKDGAKQAKAAASSLSALSKL